MWCRCQGLKAGPKITPSARIVSRKTGTVPTLNINGFGLNDECACSRYPIILLASATSWLTATHAAHVALRMWRKGGGEVSGALSARKPRFRCYSAICDPTDVVTAAAECLVRSVLFPGRFATQRACTVSLDV